MFVLALLAIGGLTVSACSAGGAASFDPSSACTTDVRQSGAYPELEARIPATFRGAAPDRLDSGRNCTADNLGTLRDDGITEVRFAGGLWQQGAESGTTLAVFEGAGLTAEAMGHFYEVGAAGGRKTSDIQSRAESIQGRDGWRIDLVNNDQLQTIVAWPSADGAAIQVVLVGTAARDVGGDAAAHDRLVDDAIAAFG
jgi:hypothetical protein